MGRRTGKNPTVEDSFLWRICHAIDETPRELARNIGVRYKDDMEPLLEGQRGMMAEIDRDEVWWKIDKYVGTRLALMLAIKGELSKALQKDRAKRIKRVAETKRIYDRNS